MQCGQGGGAWSARTRHGTLRHCRRVWERLRPPVVPLSSFLAWYWFFYLLFLPSGMYPISLHTFIFSSAGIECALFCDHGPPWMFGLES